jgi:hypothetical protein
MEETKADKRKITSALNAEKARFKKIEKLEKQKLLASKYKDLDTSDDESQSSEEEILFIPSKKMNKVVKEKKVNKKSEKSDNDETEKLKNEFNEMKQMMMMIAMKQKTKKKPVKKIYIEKPLPQVPLVQPLIVNEKTKSDHDDMIKNMQRKILNF